MKTISISQILSVIVLSSTVFFSSGAAAMKNSTIQSDMAKCEVAFKKAQSGNMSQAQAWKARQQHKKLVKKILHNLNTRNSAISTATGEVLSNKEVLNNFKVMGRLLEMLATEHPTATDEWGEEL